VTGLNPMVSGSPETVNAADSAHVQITRLSVPAAWDKIVVLLLAVSIAVNVWCGLQIRQDGMEQRLKEYDLDVYKSEFNSKLADVRVENMKIFLEQCKK